jgi:hypothetical protein
MRLYTQLRADAYRCALLYTVADNYAPLCATVEKCAQIHASTYRCIQMPTETKLNRQLAPKLNRHPRMRRKSRQKESNLGLWLVLIESGNVTSWGAYLFVF